MFQSVSDNKAYGEAVDSPFLETGKSHLDNLTQEYLRYQRAGPGDKSVLAMDDLGSPVFTTDWKEPIVIKVLRL